MKAFIATLIFLNLMVFSGYHFYADLSVLPDSAQATPELIASAPVIALISEQSSVISGSKSKPPPLEYCYSLEGISEDMSGSLFTRLDESNIVYSSETYKEDVISNYWVYIPTMPSLSKARELHDRILKLGVKDVYVIEAGRNKNKISLGLYREQNAAKEIVAWFSKKQIDVEITPRYKSKANYRVSIGPLNESDGDVLSTLIKSEFNLLNYQNKRCK